jgi:hypothetical protein
MKSRYPYIMAIAVIFIFCMTTFMASLVEARGGRGGGGRGGGGRGGGGRGGGGFSRSSPAAGGGFSSRNATRQTTRQASRPVPRQPTRDSSTRDAAREDRQDHRDDAREDRQDFIDDEWDDHHHHDNYYGGAAVVAGVAIGSAARSNYVTYVPCRTTVIVNNMTYYNCDATWYSRGYEGGEVVYIITSAPAGY